MNKKNILLVFAFLLFMQLSVCYSPLSVLAESMQMPQPLSEEERARLREVGRQNYLKYSQTQTPTPTKQTPPDSTDESMNTATKEAELETQTSDSSSPGNQKEGVEKEEVKTPWYKNLTSNTFKFVSGLWNSLKSKVSFVINKSSNIVSNKPTQTQNKTSDNTDESLKQDQTKKDSEDQATKIPEKQEEKHSKEAIYRYGVWHEPETAGYYYELGFDTWREKKDAFTSAQYYEKALEVDPNYVPALSSYGHHLGAFKNDFVKGEGYLLKAIELDPSWAFSSYNLAILYDLQGRWDDAKVWIDYTNKNFSDHPDYNYFLETFREMYKFHGEQMN